MEIFLRLATMLGLIGAGIVARRSGILDDARTAHLNAVAFYVTVPALIFISTYDRRPTEIASLELIVGMWLVIGAGVTIAWLIHRRGHTDARRSVAIVSSYHSNFGYIGLPLVSVGLGSVAAGQGSVVLGVGALTQIPLTTLLLVRINGTSVSYRNELRSIVTNPVIVSLLIGMSVAVVTWTPPTTVVTGVDHVASLALPLALLCVGASLDVTVEETDFLVVGSVVGVKVLAFPAIAFVVFTLVGANPITLATAVVMFGAPTAVSSYIYVGELGGDRRLSSTSILATTMVGVVTMSVLLYVLG